MKRTRSMARLAFIVVVMTPARVARGGAAPSSTLVIQGEAGADRATRTRGPRPT
ncbi:MAG: hypothetical protein L0H38_01445 [bacterium]|nr:hypothetical protein [bacterium]